MAANSVTQVTDALRHTGRDGLSVQDLAKNAGVSVDATRKAVKKLEQDGLAVRKDNLVYPVLRQGRRNVTVVERDEKVLAVIESAGPDGVTLNEVVEHTGASKSLVYQSIWRLRSQDKIKRVGPTRNARWVGA